MFFSVDYVDKLRSQVKYYTYKSFDPRNQIKALVSYLLIFYTENYAYRDESRNIFIIFKQRKEIKIL